jgi:hypothetical protein
MERFEYVVQLPLTAQDLAALRRMAAVRSLTVPDLLRAELRLPSYDDAPYDDAPYDDAPYDDAPFRPGIHRQHLRLVHGCGGPDLDRDARCDIERG